MTWIGFELQIPEGTFRAMSPCCGVLHTKDKQYVKQGFYYDIKRHQNPATCQTFRCVSLNHMRTFKFIKNIVNDTSFKPLTI